MYFSIWRSLLVRPEPDNTFWVTKHKSHDDPCFHKKYMEAGVMTFVAHCTYNVESNPEPQTFIEIRTQAFCAIATKMQRQRYLKGYRYILLHLLEHSAAGRIDFAKLNKQDNVDTAVKSPKVFKIRVCMCNKLKSLVHFETCENRAPLSQVLNKKGMGIKVQ